MKKVLLMCFSVFLGLTLLGQSVDCDKSKLSEIDKHLLNNFWSNFKTAINSKNSHKLTFLINFPFICDYCILDSSQEKNYHYLKVTKKFYNQGQQKIFFDKKLKQMVNKSKSLLDILSVSEENKNCVYEFSYVSVEQSKKWEGQQHFFSLKKINGKFVITSASTVP